jgi:hypothetical protein
VETTRKNKQFDVSNYNDTSSTHGESFNFAFFNKSVLCVKMNTAKGVSVQPDWALSGLDESFMELRRLTIEQGNWNEEAQWR